MSFGLRIQRANGQVTYDSNSVTWNQVDAFNCPPNGDITKHYPFLVGKEVKILQMYINPPPSDRRPIAHNTVAGVMTRVWGGNEDVYIMVLMR